MAHSLAGIDSGDRTLIRIVDTAMAEAARRSGPWLACRPGCTQCCIGPFPITQLDARRLRRALASADPDVARRVRERARQYLARVAPDYPGDPATGLLAEDAQAEQRFESFADVEPCPVLDPQTGTCDLYAARPLTCRTFGPAVRSGEDGLGTCELCYQGAGDEEIAACEVEIDPDGVEHTLLDELKEATGKQGRTIVAFAVA